MHRVTLIIFESTHFLQNFWKLQISKTWWLAMVWKFWENRWNNSRWLLWQWKFFNRLQQLQKRDLLSGYWHLSVDFLLLLDPPVGQNSDLCFLEIFQSLLWSTLFALGLASQTQAFQIGLKRDKSKKALRHLQWSSLQCFPWSAHLKKTLELFGSCSLGDPLWLSQLKNSLALWDALGTIFCPKSSLSSSFGVLEFGEGRCSP